MPNVRTSVSFAIVILLSVASSAEARPDARTLTCAEAQALLVQERAVTLTTGPNTYGRYVGPGACDGTGIAEPVSIVTKDTDQCTVHMCGPRVRRTLNR